MEKQRVAIVAEGTFGNLREEDYRIWTQSMVRVIEAARRKDPDTQEGIPRATVEIIPSAAALRVKLDTSETPPHVVIFGTNAMLDEARAIKREYPRVKVIVFFGGLFADDEVVLVSKGWNLGLEATQSVVLD